MIRNSTRNGLSSSHPFSDEIPELLEEHLDHLKGSVISIEVMKERGYESVLGKKRLADLGFNRTQQRTPGILIPVWGVNGQIVEYQYRPDRPRTIRGRLIKYENQPGSSIRLDVPPKCTSMLGDPNIPIFFVEGIKKADALASRGVCTVGLTGVWGFKGKNPFGGTAILADFDYIALKGRDSYVVYDSDYATNAQVRRAQNRLLEHLTRKGATPNVVYLPPKPDGGKQGVDDFLAAGHTIDDIKALAIEPEEANEEKEKEVYFTYAYYDRKLHLEIRRFDGTYAFAYLKDDEVRLVPEIVAGDITLRPRPLPVSEGRTLDFVGMPNESITWAKLLPPGELYKEIKAHFCKYVDLPDLDLELCIYYCVFTWFYQKVNTLGYLRYLADTGKGKSRIQRIIGDLCFYPMYASGASSFSGMARQQDKWRGTLVIDESDTQGDKEAQFIKYLNLGFERGKLYVLSDKLNPRRQEFFEPFGPKILAMREPFSDPATEGRVLSVSPHETTNPSIPIILLSNYGQEVQDLRNKLARFTLEHWEEIDGERMLDFHDLGIEPRLQQLAMPMSVIFQLWPEGAEQFRQYLLARQLEIRKLRAQSWQGGLFNLVYSIAVGDLDLQEEFASFYEPQSKEIQVVTPSMVARQMKSSAKNVTQGLASIGFEVEQKWVTFYSKDADSETKEKRKQNRAYVVPSQRVWDEMVSRYYYQEEGENNIELPEILRSKKYVARESVYVEVSHLSQVSQKEEVTISGRDSCDTCDGSTYTVNKKDSKTATEPDPIAKILGMTKEETLAIWNKLGGPVIHLGPGENCEKLDLLLSNPNVLDRHLLAVKEWLEKVAP